MDRNLEYSGIASANPFRYRGYYYDSETGFYYLQTRYYDPTICRFINADDYEIVGLLSISCPLNMYTYCNNNPIMYTDPYGYIALSIGATALAGLIALFAISIEAIYHPVANKINEIGNTVGDIYREISIGNNLNALRTSTVGVNLTNFGLNFSRERNRGRDSGFIGVGDQELNDMLKDAKRRGGIQT